MNDYCKKLKSIPEYIGELDREQLHHCKELINEKLDSLKRQERKLLIMVPEYRGWNGSYLYFREEEYNLAIQAYIGYLSRHAETKFNSIIKERYATKNFSLGEIEIEYLPIEEYEEYFKDE